LLRKELLVKSFDKESEMTNPGRNLYILKLKETCTASKQHSGIVDVAPETKNKIAFIMKNDLFFMAVVDC
jgi:hypothetical protein